MSILDVFEKDFLEVTMSHHFRVVADLPFLGKREIVEMRLHGLRDDDGDMKPEFDIDLEIFDNDVLPERFQEVEIDLDLVADALKGGKGTAEKLFDHVVETLKSAGAKLPF